VSTDHQSVQSVAGKNVM